VALRLGVLLDSHGIRLAVDPSGLTAGLVNDFVVITELDHWLQRIPDYDCLVYLGGKVGARVLGCVREHILASLFDVVGAFGDGFDLSRI
jgi:hypothetical protein